MLRKGHILVISVLVVSFGIIPVSVYAEEHEDNIETPIPIYPKYEDTWKSTKNSTYVRSFSQVTYLDIDSKDNINLLDQRAIYRISSQGEFLSYWSNLNQFGFTDLDINSKNEIYAAVSRESQVLKLSEEGKIIETWGPFETNDINIDFPGEKNLNIFVDNLDNLYISKFNSENPFTGLVKKFSPNGQVLKTFENMAQPIIQDSAGNLYGRTLENIIKYDSNGNKLAEFGGYVVDLAIDQNDVIYATHGSKKSPSMFSTSGEKFVSFGGVGIGDDRFREPRGIAVNSEGKIFVADYGKTTLLIFSSYVGPSEPVEPAKPSSMSAEESQQRYDAEIYKKYLEHEEKIKAGYSTEEIIQAYEEEIAQEQMQQEEPSESENDIICGPGTILNEENQCVPASQTKEESSITNAFGKEFADLKNFMPDDYDYEEFRYFESDTLKETQGNLFKDNVPQYSVSIFQSFDENEIWNLDKMNKEYVKFVEEISDFAPALCYKAWQGDGERPVIRCVKNNEYFVGVTAYDKNSPNPIMKSILNKIDGSSVIPSGGCLIATATFGSELAPQVQQLREIRDNHLLKTESGSTFMNGFNELYYSFSPTIADWERQNPIFKEAVKLTITPLITSLSILNYVDMDSEAEVFGYGISLILINIGMYFIVPAIVIKKLKENN